MNFLRLIRYQNLLMLAFMQLIFRYGFLKLNGVPLALTDLQYALLVLATVSIAGGGYLINNIYDQDTDGENKPGNVVVGKSITETRAYNYYVALNIIGVASGFYLANVIGRPGFSAIFIIVAGTLYLYATSLKQSLLIGNVIVAMLLSVSVLIIGVFDLLPVLTPENRSAMGVIFKVLIDYAVFAFIINLIREIVKDLEDVNGDYNNGMNTLPIALGVSRTSKLVFWLSILPVGILLYYINEYFIANDLYIAAGYGLAFVVGPMIYFTFRMWAAEHTKEFRHLSGILKIVMLFGILSILVVTMNIMRHA